MKKIANHPLNVLLFMALFMNGHDPVDLDRGLVGHWPFDRQKGRTVHDASPYEVDGELKGNPQRVPGIVGAGALEFNGAGDYVEIREKGGTPVQLRDLDKGSISVWFKARNIPVGSSILPVLYYGNKNGCKDMFDASNEGLIIEVAHGRVFSRAKGVFFTIFSEPCDLPTFCYDSHSDLHPNDLQGVIREGEWNHFVAVVGKDFNTGYLNGTEMAFRNYNFAGPSASQFFEDALKHERMWLGKGYWDHATAVFFDGFLDDLRIYDRPLDEAEVKKLYGMGKP